MEMIYLIYNGVRYEDCGKLVIMRSGSKPPHMMRTDGIVDAIAAYYIKNDGLIIIENRDNQESNNTAIMVWSHARKT